MELVTNLQCACANCGVVIDYRSDQAGQIVECPRCKEKSRLPEPLPINSAQPEDLPEIRPVAPPRLCPACGANMAPYGSTCSSCENNRRRTFGLIVGLVSAIVVLAVGWLFLKRFYSTSVPPRAAPPVNAVLSQPHTKTPKSPKDFKIGKFSLEQRRGSDLTIAVGDVQNTSANVYLHLRLYVDLLDAHGAKIETISSEVAELLPDKTWHFIYTVRNTQAKTARFATLKEMQ
jgi:hypothetical protein